MNKYEEEYVEIDVRTLHWTEFAVLFDVGGDEDVWIPKSALEDWPDKRQNGVAIVARWFAEKKGLV